MASRNFKPGAMSLESGTIKLYGRAVIGATGSISSQECQGFSLARTAVGKYQITLEDNYVALRMLATNVIDAVAAADGKIGMVTVDNVTAGSLDVQFVATDDGLAGEVGSGGIILFEITLKNSTVRY